MKLDDFKTLMGEGKADMPDILKKYTEYYEFGTVLDVFVHTVRDSTRHLF